MEDSSDALTQTPTSCLSPGTNTEGVAGPLGQLRGVEDSSDSDSDLMPQPRYKYGGR